jgi:hypothetical protein
VTVRGLFAVKSVSVKQPIAILFGPSGAPWLAALERVLRRHVPVARSRSRRSFRRDLRLTGARLVVLCDTDGAGLPNSPLLAHCQNTNVATVVCIHQGHRARLSLAWTSKVLKLRHFIVGSRSSQELREALLLLLLELSNAAPLRDDRVQSRLQH